MRSESWATSQGRSWKNPRVFQGTDQCLLWEEPRIQNVDVRPPDSTTPQLSDLVLSRSIGHIIQGFAAWKFSGISTSGMPWYAMVCRHHIVSTLSRYVSHEFAGLVQLVPSAELSSGADPNWDSSACPFSDLRCPLSCKTQKQGEIKKNLKLASGSSVLHPKTFRKLSETYFSGTLSSKYACPASAHKSRKGSSDIFRAKYQVPQIPSATASAIASAIASAVI